MAVKYQASTVTNLECDDSKIDYKQPFLDGSKLKYSVCALRNNPIRVATLCLALLCALLLAGIIGQSVHYQKVEQDQQSKLTTMSKDKEDLQDKLKTEQKQKRDLETVRNDLEKTSNYLSRRKDLQQTNNNLLTEEKKQLKDSQSQLQASHDGLNKEVEQLKASKDQLQTINNALSKDKDLLQLQFDVVLKRKNELHDSYDSVTKERDNLQDIFHNVSRSKSELQTSYMKLIKEVEHLQERHNFTFYEKDEAASGLRNLMNEILKLRVDYATLKIQEDILTLKFGKAMSNISEFGCINQTRERERLQKMNDDLTEERSLLQRGMDSLNATLDKKACQSGWRKFESSCFFTSTVKKTWTLAREYCQNKGAELAIITSKEEMRFVNGLYGSDKDIWIGLTDKGVEGQWKWVDGTPLTTAFWAKGQPDIHRGRLQLVKDAKMAVKYQASTVTNLECDDSKIDYKQPFLDGSKLKYSVCALRNNPIRVATLCLALLCALLLAGIIGQSVHYQKVEQDQQSKLTTMSKDKEDLQDKLKTEQKQKRDLETVRNELEKTSNYLSRRKDLQQTNNNLLTEEKKQLKLSQSQLQASHDGLNKEVEQLKASKNQLQTINNALSKDKDLLQLQFDLVLKRKNELRDSYDSVTKERDNLQDIFHNVSRSKSELQTSYMKLIKEVEHLQERHNFTFYEKDEAASGLRNLMNEILKLRVDYATLKIQEDILTLKFGKAMSNISEFGCINQTRERERLQKMNDDLTEERSLLQRGMDSLNATLDKKACQSGWRKFESSCFFTSTVKKTWTLAREYCQNKGAELAIITSKEEMRFVNGLYGSDKEVWIGLTDNGVEGQWEWVDGTPLTTAFWAKGQPNSHSGRNQDCVEFWRRESGAGEWNDENCKIIQFFICEI
ncbi:uncharacterized protein LKV04_001778 [Tautogolabrus adspersus]